MAIGKRMMLGLAAGALGLAALVPSQTMASRTEQPKYEVEAQHDDPELGTWEVRNYAPRLVAEVDVEGDARRASSAGFRVLANFIFGNNRGSTSIAMTAPVEQSAAGVAVGRSGAIETSGADDRWTIAFTMPSKFTLATLPTPVDARVRIREVPASRHAVLAFSGAPTAATVERRIAAFETRIRDAGYAVAAEATRYARYDPPWTLPALRRNEIVVALVPK